MCIYFSSFTLAYIATVTRAHPLRLVWVDLWIVGNERALGQYQICWQYDGGVQREGSFCDHWDYGFKCNKCTSWLSKWSGSSSHKNFFKQPHSTNPLEMSQFQEEKLFMIYLMVDMIDHLTCYLLNSWQ